jgi:uncharacterized protein with PIN domain
MTGVDTSALLAILEEEPDAAVYAQAIRYNIRSMRRK